MRKCRLFKFIPPLFLTFIALLILCLIFPVSYDLETVRISRTFADICPFGNQIVVIDAGHGGEDGGAVSISGAIESEINLEIAQRLDQIMGFYGINTFMLRNSDISLHDANASSIREKKISDLHNRVKIIESFKDPVLISIHQNSFSDKKYRGAQVFYANDELSLILAQITQNVLRGILDPDNARKPAAAPQTVYLMNHISCKAILVECGFLSNPEEDELLQSSNYQKKLAASLVGAYIQFHQITREGES